MTTNPRPSCREDFEVAIICALPVEFNAMTPQFDEFWDKTGDSFGRADGDVNIYTTGRMGQHNVVLTLLPRIGKLSAGAAVAYMRSSYRTAKLVILAGICGGVPFHRTGEMLLGDVVIGKTVVQHDFGSQYPHGFKRKNTFGDVVLGMSDKRAQNFLAFIDTDHGRETLEERTCYFLRQVQVKYVKHRTRYMYPGTLEDKLFESNYRHIHHHETPSCICSHGHGTDGRVCNEALTSSCNDLGCNEKHLRPRQRLEERRECERKQGQPGQVAYEPAVHVGAFASGDTVMKSGQHRDQIADKEGIIAFEMEGAGIWEEMPCIIVKGVCDYADSHKNERWQKFAAAVAASATKAILERYPRSDGARAHVNKSPSGHFLVPFGRNQGFVGREPIVSKIVEKVWPGANEDDCQRIAIEGLGGVGKTQIALEVAYRIRDQHPDCSVFWVPALDASSFEKAYHDIGKQLKTAGVDEGAANVMQLVKDTLSNNETVGKWCFIVDNADDVEPLFGATGLASCLPFSRKGAILFTTRCHDVAVKLDISRTDTVSVAAMNGDEALGLLRKGLKENQVGSARHTKRLLEFLANLPLAIKQASAYMMRKQITTCEYLEICQSRPEDAIELLGRSFQDKHRYQEVQNPVATTWFTSFDHIAKHDGLAADYLKFMSLLMDRDIPKSLLPRASRLAVADAIGTLKAYAFIVEREGQDVFDVHHLVRLALQNWLKDKGELRSCVKSTMERLTQVFPRPRYENRDVWMRYLPHAQSALQFRAQCEMQEDTTIPVLQQNVSDCLALLGRYQRAEELQRQTLELSEKVRGADDPDMMYGMTQLATLIFHLGRYNEAEHLEQRILQIKRKVLGPDDVSTLKSMRGLAKAAFEQGKYTEAELILRRQLELRQRVPTRDFLLYTLYAMSDLALVLVKMGKYKEAKRMGRRALKLSEKLDRTNPNVLISMSDLGFMLTELGELNEAEKLNQETLVMAHKTLGDHHPQTLTSTNNLAVVLADAGKYTEAEHMNRRALRLKRKVLGKEHPDTLASMDNLAFSLFHQGKYTEAKKLQQRAVQTGEKILGHHHPYTLNSINYLTLTLLELGKHNEAELMARRALQLSVDKLGTLDIMATLAYILMRVGKYEESECLCRETLAQNNKIRGKHHPKTLDVMEHLATVLSALRKCDEAEELFRDVLELRERKLGKDHPATLKTRVVDSSPCPCDRTRGKEGEMSLSNRVYVSKAATKI